MGHFLRELLSLVSRALPDMDHKTRANRTRTLEDGQWHRPPGSVCSGKCVTLKSRFSFEYVTLGYLKERIEDYQPLELWLIQNPISITAAVSWGVPPWGCLHGIKEGVSAPHPLESPDSARCVTWAQHLCSRLISFSFFGFSGFFCCCCSLCNSPICPGCPGTPRSTCLCPEG